MSAPRHRWQALGTSLACWQACAWCQVWRYLVLGSPRWRYVIHGSEGWTHARPACVDKGEGDR